MRAQEIFEADTRDTIQKILDMLNHSETEETIKSVALTRLNSLAKEIGKVVQFEDGIYAVVEPEQSAEQVEKNQTALVAGPTFLVGSFDHELHAEDFGKYWISDPVYTSMGRQKRGKKVKYEQVISAIMPLNPIKFHFSKGTHNAPYGPHVRIWFNVDNEPTQEQLSSAFKQAGLKNAGVVEKPKYERIGKMFVCVYFVSFSKFGTD